RGDEGRLRATARPASTDARDPRPDRHRSRAPTPPPPRLGALEGRRTIVPRPAPPVNFRTRARRHGRAHGDPDNGVSREPKPPRFPLTGEEQAHPLEKAALWA